MNYLKHTDNTKEISIHFNVPKKTEKVIFPAEVLVTKEKTYGLEAVSNSILESVNTFTQSSSQAQKDLGEADFLKSESKIIWKMKDLKGSLNKCLKCTIVFQEREEMEEFFFERALK